MLRLYSDVMYSCHVVMWLYYAPCAPGKALAARRRDQSTLACMASLRRGRKRAKPPRRCPLGFVGHTFISRVTNEPQRTSARRLERALMFKIYTTPLDQTGPLAGIGRGVRIFGFAVRCGLQGFFLFFSIWYLFVRQNYERYFGFGVQCSIQFL